MHFGIFMNGKSVAVVTVRKFSSILFLSPDFQKIMSLLLRWMYDTNSTSIMVYSRNLMLKSDHTLNNSVFYFDLCNAQFIVRKTLWVFLTNGERQTCTRIVHNEICLTCCRVFVCTTIIGWFKEKKEHMRLPVNCLPPMMKRPNIQFHEINRIY